MRKLVLILATYRSFLTTHVEGRYWNQFRGPDGDGKSDAQNLTIQFTESRNVRWKIPIHNQVWSSPVVWGNQIWLATAHKDGMELFAICTDLGSGKIVHDITVFDVSEPQQLWERLNTHAIANMYIAVPNLG